MHVAGGILSLRCDYCKNSIYTGTDDEGIRYFEELENVLCPVCAIPLWNASLHNVSIRACKKCRGMLVGMNVFEGLIDQLRGEGWQGEAMFALLQALVALIGFLPASLLGIAAGATYGLWIGFGLSATGMMVGAAIAFAIARSALRPAIVRLFGHRMVLNRFDANVAHDGWRLVLMIRISPVMPFSITSYALGLSGVSLRDYLLGTTASTPALFLYVALGAMGAHSMLTVRGNSFYVASLVIGVLAAVAVILRLRRLFVAAASARAPKS